MTTKMINNPAGVWGIVAQIDPIVLVGINNAAGTLTQGDVVVAQVAGPGINTSTTANDKTVLGVVTSTKDLSTDATTMAVGAPTHVITGGWARVQIAANTVAVGDILTQSAVAKVAVTNNAATVGMVLGIALEASAAKDVNNTIRVLVKPA